MTDRDRLMQHDDGSVFITNSASTFFSPISIVHTPYQMSRSITHTYSALVGGADSPSLSAVKSIRAKKEPRLSFRRKKSIDLRTAKPPASPRLASLARCRKMPRCQKHVFGPDWNAATWWL